MLAKTKHHLFPFQLSIKINTERPDFRVVADFLFASDQHNYDSDGNSYPYNSRKWTELELRSRVWDDYGFYLYRKRAKPLIFTICASRKYIAYAIAYFLALETQGQILDKNGNTVKLEHIKNKLKNFQLDRHLSFAKNSIWRKSSDDHSDPN
ncbi:hypothetical protein [Acinetobacter sp. CFCC 10889]|uniref:hypothetical protein n=1 Tax=Acinetobacter sp. CFCC 10889 TaxID=1775557 RepID=UPI000DD033A6|nr:hypothetical protein [Acinetobacter sp. CFCC 10889]